MKKFKVRFSEVTYYEDTYILANDRKEAMNKFRELLEENAVEVVETESIDYECEEVSPSSKKINREEGEKKMNFTDIRGQEHIKRGLEVACVGNHSVVLVGTPKSGKTMFVKRIPTITDTPIEISELKPCPCGHFTNPFKECHCTPYQIQRHISK